jgi:hypothetical protein
MTKRSWRHGRLRLWIVVVVEVDSADCAFIGNRGFKGCYVFLFVSSELLIVVTSSGGAIRFQISA